MIGHFSYTKMESQVSFYILATIVLICATSCYRNTLGRFYSDSLSDSPVKSGQINPIASNKHLIDDDLDGLAADLHSPHFTAVDSDELPAEVEVFYDTFVWKYPDTVHTKDFDTVYRLKEILSMKDLDTSEAVTYDALLMQDIDTHDWQSFDTFVWQVFDDTLVMNHSDILVWKGTFVTVEDIVFQSNQYKLSNIFVFLCCYINNFDRMEHLKFVTKSKDVLKCEDLCDRQKYTLKQIYKTTFRFWFKVKPLHRVSLCIPARWYRLQQQCIHQNLAMCVVTVISAEMTNQFRFNIKDVNNVKIEIFSATYIIVNSETAAIVWLTVMLLLSFICVLLSFIYVLFSFNYVREMNLLDNWMDQDSAVRNRGLRKNNARKENEQTCETLSKDCMSDATPYTSVQEEVQPNKAVGQLHITKYNNEETVATNGNTVNDNEEQTDDINTTETVNFETENNISECLRPQTALLSMHNHSTEVYAAQEDELMCKICYMEESSVVFLPCGHMLACESCSIPFQRCAVCRAVIKAMLKAERK